MSFRDYLKNRVKSRVLPLTTLELIALHKICSPMNNLEFKMNSAREDEPRAWLNPNDQDCFNSGWFTEEDFKDWMNGTGKIVKGETPEEKKKFWDYATFLKTYKHGWMIRYNKEFFDKLIEKPKTESFDTRSHETTTPLKITKTNKEEIIGTIFGDMVTSLTNDLIGIGDDDDYVMKRFRDETWGAKLTLYRLGCGFFGYSNTPRTILNLSWVPDVVVAKAYYNYLVTKNVELPDFDFIINYRK